MDGKSYTCSCNTLHKTLQEKHSSGEDPVKFCQEIQILLVPRNTLVLVVVEVVVTFVVIGIEA